MDDNNHALAALRYMVTKIDAHQLGRIAKKAAGETAGEGGDNPKRPEKKWLSYRNEALWTRIW